ncbi:MAG: hypothetical protein ABI852_11505 [Gemmatimonadaceae bacterium]
MQVFGVLTFVASLAAILSMRSFRASLSPEMFDLLLRNVILYRGLTMLSYVFIGRALLRREKWGAYVAVATIAVPAVIRLIWPVARTDPFQTVVQVAAFTTLGLILTVWKELGSVADSELAEHGKAPELTEPLTPRNRGFGEAPADLADDEHLDVAIPQLRARDERGNPSAIAPENSRTRETPHTF